MRIAVVIALVAIGAVLLATNVTSDCSNWQGQDSCVGNQTSEPEIRNQRRWQTPPRTDATWSTGFQDYNSLVGYAQVQYDSAHASAIVSVFTLTKDNSTKLQFSFNGQPAISSNQIKVDQSWTDPVQIVVTASNGAKLVLDDVDLMWNNPAVNQGPQYQNGQKGAIVELFGWPYTDIAAECEAIGKMGYMGVKVFPPQESVLSNEWLQNNELNPWYFIYQPVSYRLQGRSGTREQLRDMIVTCRKAGVRVYADAVVNHMSGGGNDVGPHRNSAGSSCVYWGAKNSTAGSPYFTQAPVRPPSAAQVVVASLAAHLHTADGATTAVTDVTVSEDAVGNSLVHSGDLADDVAAAEDEAALLALMYGADEPGGSPFADGGTVAVADTTRVESSRCDGNSLKAGDGHIGVVSASHTVAPVPVPTPAADSRSTAAAPVVQPSAPSLTSAGLRILTCTPPLVAPASCARIGMGGRGGGVAGATGYGPSPFPRLDLFVTQLVGGEGAAGRGYIRSWMLYPETKSILYSILGNRWCGNVGRAHKSNSIYFVIDLRRLELVQKCYDPDCALYRGPPLPVPAHCLDDCTEQGRKILGDELLGGVLAQPIEPTADEWDAIDTVAAAAELAGAGAFDDVL